MSTETKMPDGSWGSLEAAERAWSEQVSTMGGSWVWWLSMENHHPSCLHYEWGPCNCSQLFREVVEVP